MNEIWHFCPSPVDVAREQGGVANVVGALALESAAAGVPTTVICGDHELGKKSQEIGEASPRANLRIVTLKQRANPALGPLNGVASMTAAVPHGAVAHVHTCFSAFSDCTMHRLHKRGIPFVFSAHGKLSRAALRNRTTSKTLWWSAFSKRSIDRASRVCANSPGEARDMAQIGLNARLVTIPNGYAHPHCDSWRNERPIVAGRYVLFLGYLDPRKRPELLIEALSLSSRRGDLKLVMVGPDSYGYRQVLEEHARALGVAAPTIFYGPAFGVEKWNLIANAACLCLPSRAEGMPLVVVEALGAGTPVLVSPECNASDIVAAGAGLEVPQASGAAWAEAIDQFLGSSERAADMKRSAEHASSGYTWHAIGTRWLDLYRAVSAEKAQSWGQVSRLGQPA